MYNLKIQQSKLPFILAIYFAAIFNLSFLSYFYNILQNSGKINYGFAFSVLLSLILILNILFTLINIKYLNKPIIIFLLLISSIVSYEQYFYGVIFNDEMIDNLVQTNFGESISFVNPSIISWFIITGLLPSIILLRTEIIYAKFKQSIFKKIISCTISIILIISFVSYYYITYASVGRNNNRLANLIVPTYFFYGATKFIKAKFFSKKNQYQQLGLDAKNKNNYDGKNNLLIILLGETARSTNYQLNGYNRETNLYTKNIGLISFKNVNSCGTSTSVSVPCIFSSLPRKKYSRALANRQDNLLDILTHADLNTLWIDNDGGCKDVCNRIKTVKIKPKPSKFCDNIYCVDEVLLEKLKEELNNKNDNKDKVIVLHLIGSHGPTYYKRYPKEHRHFIPDCQRSDIQNCSAQELVNSYDNTILYTDYILKQTIDLAEKNATKFRSAVVYISDHGESLGENGLYLHGAPYFMAPKEQTLVPWMVWLSKDFGQKNKINLDTLKQNTNANYSHDNFFSSILGLMQIQTSLYDKNLDVFNHAKQS